jgi:hypothetical protein
MCRTGFSTVMRSFTIGFTVVILLLLLSLPRLAAKKVLK